MASHTTLTRLDPDLPMCWEDADTVRIGFERARACVRHPSAATQRLLGMLSVGIASSSMSRAVQAAGATAAEARSLLRDLEPALLRVPQAPALSSDVVVGTPQIALFDDGREVPGLRHAIESCGDWHLNTSLAPELSDLIFHVERYLEPLDFAQRWQAARTPHLLIRYSDRGVHVGPLVDCSPRARKAGPCHSCLSLAHVAQDKQAPALAAQLYGRRPQSESTDAAEMTVAIAALIVRQWRSSDPRAQVTRYVIPMKQGRVSDLPSAETVAPHAECGCQGL